MTTVKGEILYIRKHPLQNLFTFTLHFCVYVKPHYGPFGPKPVACCKKCTLLIKLLLCLTVFSFS